MTAARVAHRAARLRHARRAPGASGPVVLLAMTFAIGTASFAASGCAASTETPAQSGDAVFAQAFEDRAHDVPVEGAGTVTRILEDDDEGGRHQRFIVRLASGQTLLVAHNIDVAPRVDGLRVGDTVEFAGVYEWSEEGGTVHWTHHDPDGTHASGWLRHEGRTYE